MPRPRQRACLEAGLKLDINKLTRQGLFRPRGKVGPCTINWTNSYTGDVIAGGQITAYLESDYAGWFRIQIGELDQWIDLMAQPRHFGGRQWYFKSPITHRCSVLWMPLGARRFCGRHEWEGQVAYASQFDAPEALDAFFYELIAVHQCVPFSSVANIVGGFWQFRLPSPLVWPPSRWRSCCASTLAASCVTCA
jgi:hypothetical protein